MKKILCTILVLSLLMSLTGCASGTNDLMENVQPSGMLQPNLTGNESESAGDFGIRLFRESYDSQSNTLISPLSVLCALAMTANGAKGETLAQMEAVLGLDVQTLNDWISGYMAALEKSGNGKLSLANSIWFKDTDSFTVNQDFLQRNADYYSAGLFKAPFDGSTKNDINRWVEENTDGMVKDILDDIPEGAVMYLVNALAFDAQWQEIYQNSAIREAAFSTGNGVQISVDMMYSTESDYLEDDYSTGFIKYYEDADYAFVALMPNLGVTVEEYLKSLTGDDLQALLSEPQNITVHAGIPKFELEYDVEMSEILKSMGMTDAFKVGLADFSSIGTSTEGNLYINRVLHKTYICVDGKGTRAGAATAVEVACGSAAFEEDSRTVILNRPFVYMLIDTESKLPFFIGTMMDPSGKFEMLTLEEPVGEVQLTVMTVKNGDDKFSISSGNYSMENPVENGEMMGFIACGSHPLAGVQPREFHAVTGDSVTLSFAAEPDEITIRRWPGSDMGNVDAVGEQVTIDGLTLPIEKGEWIYEIRATWNRDGFSGEAIFHLYISR